MSRVWRAFCTYLGVNVSHRCPHPRFQVGQRVWLFTQNLRLRLPCYKLSPVHRSIQHCLSSESSDVSPTAPAVISYPSHLPCITTETGTPPGRRYGPEQRTTATAGWNPSIQGKLAPELLVSQTPLAVSCGLGRV